jgi:hypothetical protein
MCVSARPSRIANGSSAGTGLVLLLRHGFCLSRRDLAPNVSRREDRETDANNYFRDDYSKFFYVGRDNHPSEGMKIHWKCFFLFLLRKTTLTIIFTDIDGYFLLSNTFSFCVFKQS